MKAKALFLDRDGVINVDKKYVHKIEDFEFFDEIFELCELAAQGGAVHAGSSLFPFSGLNIPGHLILFDLIRQMLKQPGFNPVLPGGAVMAAAPSLKMLVTAVIEKIPCLVSDQIMPALLTDKDPSENIYFAGGITPGVPPGQFLHPVKLFLTDGSRAEVRVISSVPVIDTYGQLIMEHPPESGVTPVYTIGLTDVPDGGTLGSAPLIIIKSVPQDGRIALTVAGRQVDLRVSCLPTVHGESVVLRVLDRSAVSLDLENIGLPEDIYDGITIDIEKPNGIFIVTGPTGSGKTTTLYSCLRYINKPDVKILTAEEPVEYDIEGLVQVPINPQQGNTFAKVLRAFLRQDPDIIMVGEIRDLETAEIAVQAALTGHFVFSTLHTNDAAGAVTRLVDMNVAPYLISSTLQAVLAQRLVRTCCSNCKTFYDPDDEALQRLGLTRDDIGNRKFAYGKGCKVCNATGYKGRKGVFEFLRMSNPIREMINAREPTLVIREKARELGMRTMREDAIRNVLDGYTTVDEVLRYT